MDRPLLFIMDFYSIEIIIIFNRIIIKIYWLLYIIRYKAHFNMANIWL